MSRGLIFTRSSAVSVAHIAPAVVVAFVAAQASIAATFPSHLGSDRQGTLLLASYHRHIMSGRLTVI
jgi:hypothetical protein